MCAEDAPGQQERNQSICLYSGGAPGRSIMYFNTKWEMATKMELPHTKQIWVWYIVHLLISVNIPKQEYIN